MHLSFSLSQHHSVQVYCVPLLHYCIGFMVTCVYLYNPYGQSYYSVFGYFGTTCKSFLMGSVMTCSDDTFITTGITVMFHLQHYSVSRDIHYHMPASSSVNSGATVPLCILFHISLLETTLPGLISTHLLSMHCRLCVSCMCCEWHRHVGVPDYRAMARKKKEESLSIMRAAMWWRDSEPGEESQCGGRGMKRSKSESYREEAGLREKYKGGGRDRKQEDEH